MPVWLTASLWVPRKPTKHENTDTPQAERMWQPRTLQEEVTVVTMEPL